jgi:hypothetical protein
MAPLPDEALVVRGGQNLPESFAKGSGVTIDVTGKVEGVSVNAGYGLSVEELTAPIPKTGYPGIPHAQIGVTSVKTVRAAGGDVVPSPRRNNPHHATLSGLMPEQASNLFQPTQKNPNVQKS